MSPHVINARFASMKMMGVQKASYEIVSRLVRHETEQYYLVSPKHAKNTISLPVVQKGHLRRGHLWEQLELPLITRGVDRKAVLYSPMTSGPLMVSRQVMTVHDLFYIEHPEWFSKAFTAWYGWLIPRLVDKVAYVIANSHYTRERVLERYNLPEDKVVLCHFAQSERYKPAPTEAVNRFRETQGLPTRYLLYIGAIEPRKNLSTLLAAWSRTLAREQGVTLVVVGGVAPRSVYKTRNLDTAALEDPSVYRMSYVAEEKLPLLYQGAEAFVFPSLAEGFGLTLLEAMACGTPVICSNTTAMPETAGGAARLVPPLEVEAWVEAIDSVVSDFELRQHMRSAGIKRASEFSWSSSAEIVRNVLNSV